VRRNPGNDLILGKMPGRDRSLGLSREERDKHLYVCGGTGTGKSKFLENLIRQDIGNWNIDEFKETKIPRSEAG
jgi:DNA helicase HerA-like ATPase